MSRSCLMTLSIQPRRLSLRVSILRAKAAKKQDVSFMLKSLPALLSRSKQTKSVFGAGSLGDVISATLKKTNLPQKPSSSIQHHVINIITRVFSIFQSGFPLLLSALLGRNHLRSTLFLPPKLNFISATFNQICRWLFWCWNIWFVCCSEKHTAENSSFSLTCLILELLKVLLSNFTEQCLRKSLNIYLKFSKPAEILTVIQSNRALLSSCSENPQLTRF